MVLPAPDTLHPQPLLPFPQEQQALTAAWGVSTLARKHEASRGRTYIQHRGGKSSAPPPSCEKPPHPFLFLKPWGRAPPREAAL